MSSLPPSAQGVDPSEYSRETRDTCLLSLIDTKAHNTRRHYEHTLAEGAVALRLGER